MRSNTTLALLGFALRCARAQARTNRDALPGLGKRYSTEPQNKLSKAATSGLACCLIYN